MLRRPPRSTRTDTLFPYTTLFRSKCYAHEAQRNWEQSERTKDASFHSETCVKLSNTLILVMFRLIRSEEHTSELQSLMRISYAVFCLNKKTKQLPLHQHVISL